jgi:hypothetical protein
MILATNIFPGAAEGAAATEAEREASVIRSLKPLAANERDILSDLAR